MDTLVNGTVRLSPCARIISDVRSQGTFYSWETSVSIDL